MRARRCCDRLSRARCLCVLRFMRLSEGKGTVPVLKWGDMALTDSGDIVEFVNKVRWHGAVRCHQSVSCAHVVVRACTRVHARQEIPEPHLMHVFTEWSKLCVAAILPALASMLAHPAAHPAGSTCCPTSRTTSPTRTRPRRKACVCVCARSSRRWTATWRPRSALLLRCAALPALTAAGPRRIETTFAAWGSATSTCNWRPASSTSWWRPPTSRRWICSPAWRT